MRRLPFTAFLCVGAALSQSTDTQLTVADKYKQGHSHNGAAFDTGPRTKPEVMPGIGASHFPISTKNPEVQKWFDQGNTLLHSFSDYDAERAFRWCLKLEPGNAMAYWGLARAAADSTRSREFLAEASKRKKGVTERERLYIEALEALNTIDTLRDRGPTYRQRNEDYKRVLETISVRYPKDIEARALLALANMGSDRYGTERIIREVLETDPNHPGAHHYRIHNWNHHESEQALESCKRYGEIAPGIGHAQHMPGHIYATVGMWQEAGISMDAATRVEVRRMGEQMVFPFNYWNYGHNRNYLSYIQEQLGMPSQSMKGARAMLEGPLDPQGNLENPYSNYSQGVRALSRALIKYERWDDILNEKTIPWRDIVHDKMHKFYSRTRAYIAKGDEFLAQKSFEEHAALSKEMEKNKSGEEVYKTQAQELRGRLAIMRGETLTGLGLLAQAADEEFEQQASDNDPPSYPELLYTALGREYLKAGSPVLAVTAFEKALIRVRNDIFSLSGLVEAHSALGHKKEAGEAMARLQFFAADAEPDLPVFARAKATGATADPKDISPGPQRNYKRFALDKLGPPLWSPFKAPQVDLIDTEGKHVSLDQYKGKNIVLVYYLGRECLHCMKQLQDMAGRNGEWEKLDAVVLAASPNMPEKNVEYLKTISLPGVKILSDPAGANAKRFRSYDDFEDMELHSTLLIDKQGRVHWSRTGGAPFSDLGFLTKQLERMNALKL